MKPDRRGRYAAEPSLPAAKLANGGQQVGCPEVRLHHTREDQLCVCALPQQKIAKAALSAGANELVDGRAEGLAERFVR